MSQDFGHGWECRSLCVVRESVALERRLFYKCFEQSSQVCVCLPRVVSKFWGDGPLLDIVHTLGAGVGAFFMRYVQAHCIV